jgi:hypothetical protein
VTTTEPITNAWGREATGIPPIQCPSWCTDPGHVAEIFPSDQRCYSENAYVTASLGEVKISEYGVGESTKPGDPFKPVDPFTVPCRFRVVDAEDALREAG